MFIILPSNPSNHSSLINHFNFYPPMLSLTNEALAMVVAKEDFQHFNISTLLLITFTA
jgi:hypothetical protein